MNQKHLLFILSLSFSLFYKQINAQIYTIESPIDESSEKHSLSKNEDAQNEKTDSRTVFIYSFDGSLSAYDLKNFERKWRFYVTPTPDGRNRLPSGNEANKFHLENGVIYVANPNGVLYALNSNTGNVFWEFNTRKGRMRKQNPKVYQNKICIANENVFCLNAKTGDLVWEFQPDMKNHPSFFGNYPGVFIDGKYNIAQTRFVYNFDIKGGDLVNKRRTKRLMYSIPKTDGKNLIIPDESSTLYSLNPFDLQTNWYFKLEEDQYHLKNTVEVKNDSVYMATWKNPNSKCASVYCLDGKTGEKLWRADFTDRALNHISLSDKYIYGYSKESSNHLKLILFQIDKTGDILLKEELDTYPVSNIIEYKEGIIFYAKEGLVYYDLRLKTETILIKNTSNISKHQRLDSQILITK